MHGQTETGNRALVIVCKCGDYVGAYDPERCASRVLGADVQRVRESECVNEEAIPAARS
jgi:hypothetical protein